MDSGGFPSVGLEGYAADVKPLEASLWASGSALLLIILGAIFVGPRLMKTPLFEWSLSDFGVMILMKLPEVILSGIMVAVIGVPSSSVGKWQASVMGVGFQSIFHLALIFAAPILTPEGLAHRRVARSRLNESPRKDSRTPGLRVGEDDEREVVIEEAMDALEEQMGGVLELGTGPEIRYAAAELSIGLRDLFTLLGGPPETALGPGGRNGGPGGAGEEPGRDRA
ncbi:hypothetical protein [Streptomyces sp. Agncl-13]|uniref:hypothetical protein n=1 Tax=Streptomyces sp. Agncl-13 TaxID=3400628 RepID=UPI003A87D071